MGSSTPTVRSFDLPSSPAQPPSTDSASRGARKRCMKRRSACPGGRGMYRTLRPDGKAPDRHPVFSARRETEASMRAIAASAALLSLLAVAACDAGGKNADVSSAGPQLHIASPKMDQTFASADKAEVLFDLREYEVGKVEDGKSGQHLHLIVDDMPYEAVY